jgi:large subunit ribosomal protein L25
MKQITLNTKIRAEVGRSASRNSRQQGILPAVLYGESGLRNLTLNMHDFAMAYRKIAGSAALIELKTEGDSEPHYAIIQELQRNTRTDAFLHVDFKEIVRGKDMEADIPVRTRGVADGVRNYGGVLEVSSHTLRVRCRPRHLPEAIIIDVAALAIGKSIHLSEIAPPEGVTFLADPELVVVACVGASGGSGGVEATPAEVAAAEAAAQPAATQA